MLVLVGPSAGPDGTGDVVRLVVVVEVVVVVTCGRYNMKPVLFVGRVIQCMEGTISVTF